MSITHASHFESAAHQEHAARLGMWIFLASELLLFAGLFALYIAYRAHTPAAFALAVEHNARILGTANTAILLTSSFAVAMAVDANRHARPASAVALLFAAFALGALFLILKFTEYGMHFREGIYPGGRGDFFVTHPVAGLPIVFTLYFVMTGLHAVHVTVGMALLAWLAVRTARHTITAEREHPLVLGALYWHLVDVIWIFLWPMFYLLHGR